MGQVRRKKNKRGRMMAVLLSLCLLGVGIPINACAEEPTALVWVEDGLTKIFKASQPSENASEEIRLDAARGGYWNAQLAVRSGSAAIEMLSVEASSLTGPGGEIIEQEFITAVFEEFVTLDANTSDLSPEDRLNAPDGSLTYPDRITKSKEMKNLPAETTQPIWYSVYIPENVPAGTYSGSVTVCCNETAVASVPVSVTVYDVTLPTGAESEYRIYHWLGDFWDTADPMTQYGVEKWSEDWWKVIESYARYMKKIRNNVVFLDVMDLTLPISTIHEDGSVEYNFDRFDRFVQIFEDAGAIGYLHASSFLGWEDTFVIPDKVVLKDGKPTLEYIHLQDLEDGKPNQFMLDFFTQLDTHLREKGWLDRYAQGGGSEPQADVDYEVVNWFYDTMQEYFPQFHIDDPNHVFKPTPNIGSYVIKQDNYDQHKEHWQALQSQGKDIMLYVCSPPADGYMNRLTQMELAKALLLHWYTFENDMVGYLHWGFNVWYGDDVLNKGDARWTGDAYIVYPDKENLDVFSSIRSEAQLEGAQDHALMELLAQRGQKARALEIARSIVQSGNTYTTNHNAIYAARRALLESLAPQEGITSFTDDLRNTGKMFECGAELVVENGSVSMVPFPRAERIDRLADFSNTLSHTPNLSAGQGAVRTADTQESVVYQQDDLTGFRIKVQAGERNAFAAFTSKDGSIWTKVEFRTEKEKVLETGVLEKEFTAEWTENGVQYLRIDFLQTGEPFSRAKLQEVILMHADTTEYLSNQASFTYYWPDLHDFTLQIEYSTEPGLEFEISADGRTWEKHPIRLGIPAEKNKEHTVEAFADDVPAGVNYVRVTFTDENIGEATPKLSHITLIGGVAEYKSTRPVWTADAELKIDEIGQDSVLVSWAQAKGDVDEYHVFVDGVQIEQLDANERTFRAGNLSPEREHQIAIVAFQGEEASAALSRGVSVWGTNQPGDLAPDMLSVQENGDAGFQAKIRLLNRSAGVQNAVVIGMLCREDGQMLQMRTEEVSLESEKAQEAELHFEAFSVEEGFYIEFLVWDSCEKMTPLTHPLRYTLAA